MLSGLVRRSVPLRAAAPVIDWSKFLTKYEGEERAELLTFKNHLATIEAKYQEYSTQPEPIDWAGYKEAFGGHPEIARVENDFENFAYPKHKPTTADEVRKEMDPKFVAAAETVENSKAAVEELTERVQYLKDHMTHEYTTVEEHLAKYPGLEEYIDDQIARHQYFDDPPQQQPQA